MSGFIHLHNHFDVGSPKDSAQKIEDGIIAAKKIGMDAYAITDHGLIDGWVKFNIAATEHGIKAIYGVEMYEAVCPAKNREDIDQLGLTDIEIPGRRYFHSIFIAKNYAGIQFLRKFVDYSLKRENLYYEHVYFLEYLQAHKTEAFGNVIWMSACIAGRVPRLLLEKRDSDALRYVQYMSQIFGSENVYIELQNHNLPDEIKVLPYLKRFASENGLQMVVTNDVHYIKKESSLARDIMLARSYKMTYDEYKAKDSVQTDELYLKTPEQMTELFFDVPEAIKNTKKIADECENITLKGNKWHYPNFVIPNGMTPSQYIEQKTWENLPKRYPINTMSNVKANSLKARISNELNVMDHMDASAYMLIVNDFIAHAKSKKIVTGPGRGSVCGSAVAYIIGITDVEPTEYNLVFERFMNPERISMPDVDTDYQDNRREEVIKYAVTKYGADKVSRIRTNGTVGAKLAIRDVGAVFPEKYDSSFVDKVAKMVPSTPGMTLDKAIKTDMAFDDLYVNNSTAHSLIDKAKLIEGLVKSKGSHAAGILISDAPLSAYGCTIDDDESDVPIFCGDMSDVEYLKLIKIDFLGLRTLTVDDETVKLILRDTGKAIQLKNLKYDDDKIFSFIASGNTSGVFQLEQAGMQQFMRDLRPKKFEDIILGIAVYRPGPMDKIPELIQNKNNPQKISYPEDAKEKLSQILDVTYGIMVYQEQVMEIVRSLAGYSYGRSDLVRRAMAHKKAAVMLHERNIFVYGEVECPHCHATGENIHHDICPTCGGTGKTEDGEICPECAGKGIPDKCPYCKGEKVIASQIACPWCNGKSKDCEYCGGKGFIRSDGKVTVEGCTRRNIGEKTANELFDQMISFAAYAFNKSHAAAYAIIAYQTAFLKYYYPRQYMTAYLNSFLGNPDKIKKYIAITKKMEIEVKRPDVLVCEDRFTEDETGIYMGLVSVKNAGKDTVNIVQARKENPFTSLVDFCTRTKIGKKDFQALVKSGALDGFHIHRSQMIRDTEKLLVYCKNQAAVKQAGQLSFFSQEENDDFAFTEIPEYDQKTMFKYEKETTGFYLSGHPLNLPEYSELLKSSNITTIDNFSETDNNKAIAICGIIKIDEKERQGIMVSKKSHKQYAIFYLEDIYSTIEVIAFSECIKEYEQNIYDGNIVSIEGTLLVEVNSFVNENQEYVQTTEVKIRATSIHTVQKNETGRTRSRRVYVKLKDIGPSVKRSITEIIEKHPGPDKLLLYDSAAKRTMLCHKGCSYSNSFMQDLCQIVTKENIVVKY